MKFLVFDIDGTLSDTTRVDDKCYMNSFDSVFGINIEDVDWSSLKNVTDWGIAEELINIKLNRQIAIEELKHLKETFVKNLKKELTTDKTQFAEIPGAVSFFKNLQNDKNYCIGIATGGWEESANLKLNVLGIDPYKFSYSNSNHFKSREQITRDVMAQLSRKSNITPNAVIYFGDGEWDFTTSKKLGIRFIGIDNRNTRKLEKLGAKEVYNNFENVNEILKSILK